MKLDKILSAQRRKKTTKPGRTLTEELASDRSRVLYSSPFRRLSKKAQVFPLETNAAVRTRVTHSLEVSDVGRWIAYYVTEELVNKGEIKPDLQLPILYAVETACLLHDIGNPPFGHFGEDAIRRWFSDNWAECYKTSSGISREEEIPAEDHIQRLVTDFLDFDGNPQGLRIILRLQRDRDVYSLNLTYTTILSLIKYARSASELKDDGLRKKAGYFESEKDIVEGLKDKLGIPRIARYPLAYIMEAADDIAYCISDIEDGIEKNIITAEDFFEELREEWVGLGGTRELSEFPLGNIDKDIEDPDARFFAFKVSYTQDAIRKAKEQFIQNYDHLLDGSISALLSEDTPEGKAIKCLKRVARRKLFRSPDAENPELAGYAIITGLLNAYKPLLTCSREQFDLLVKGRDDPSQVAGKNIDLHWRLFNKLPKKHLSTYIDQLSEFEGQGLPEWYFRAHLIVDYISGMTDPFALELFQLLNGIRLL
jgi:dGTPase